MGYEGDPLSRLGGGGCGLPLPNFTYSPYSTNIEACKVILSCMFCLTLKGDAMYTVAVRWGELVKTHKAWTLSDAKATMYAYPNKDVFIKVTNLFGQRIAVRYYR